MALTIAGSDSGGGAGVQADLKAFARCGVHGCCAITAITAQNTLGVEAIQAVPGEMVLAQVRAVARDIGVDAVKVGMLGTAQLARTVARALEELPAGTPVVVDPVMVAESGARLLERAARAILLAEILPRASVLTPNLPEARALLGRGEEAPRSGEVGQGEDAPGSGEVRQGEEDPGSEEALRSGGVPGSGEDGAREEEEEEEEEARELARALLALGPEAVVLTGGHRRRAVDLFVAREDGGGGRGGEMVEIAGPRHPDGAAHGSGCTHSSILAAQLALGRTPLQAARRARALAGEAVGRGLRDVGGGPGPVDVLGLERLREAETGSGRA